MAVGYCRDAVLVVGGLLDTDSRLSPAVCCAYERKAEIYEYRSLDMVRLVIWVWARLVGLVIWVWARLVVLVIWMWARLVVLVIWVWARLVVLVIWVWA